MKSVIKPTPTGVKECNSGCKSNTTSTPASIYQLSMNDGKVRVCRQSAPAVTHVTDASSTSSLRPRRAWRASMPHASPRWRHQTPVNRCHRCRRNWPIKGGGESKRAGGRAGELVCYCCCWKRAPAVAAAAAAAAEAHDTNPALTSSNHRARQRPHRFCRSL